MEWTSENFCWDGVAFTLEAAQRGPKTRADALLEGTGSLQPAAAERARGRGGRTPRTSIACRVPGCRAELVEEKGYYRRYRICRQHCVATCLLIEGKELRFCRPCGRLHPIADFDDGRVSCRRKLRLFAKRRQEARGEAEGKLASQSASPSGRSSQQESTDGRSNHWLYGAAQSNGTLDSPAPPALQQAKAQGQPRTPPQGEPLRGVPLALDLQEVFAVAPEEESGSWGQQQAHMLHEEALPHSSAEAAPMGMYSSDHTIARLSLKIFDCTPDQLVPGIKTELERMLGAGPILLEGSIRPGCLHLILSILMTSGQEAGMSSAEGLSNMLAHIVKSRVFGDQPNLVVRRLASAALPLCTLPGLGRHALQGVDMQSLLGTQIHCRQQGRNLTMELLRRGQALEHCSCSEAARAGLDLHLSDSCCPVVNVQGLAIGFADVEVQLGKVLSLPRAILVLPDPRAVEEVRSLEVCSAGIPDVDAFLRNTGLVMQYLHRAQALDPELSEALYTPELLRRLSIMAQELVVAAVSRGWPALARLLLPAITAGGMGASAALSSMDALSPSTLLALAASAGSEGTAEVLAEWAAAEGVNLQSPEHAASPSEAAGPSVAAETSLGEPSKVPAAGRSGPAGTRQEFLAVFHRQQLWKEIVFEATNLLAYATLAVRIMREDGWRMWSVLVEGLMVGMLPGLAIMTLAYRRSPTFIRWRTPCVVVLRTLRSYSMFVSTGNYFNRDATHPIILPWTLGRLIFHLLRMPLMSFKGTVGHALPLPANALCALSFIAPYWHFINGRCDLECAVPGQGARYQGMLAAVEGAHLAAWAPGPATCRHSCLTVSGWLMLLVGAVLPCWVLGLVEAQAWRRWQRRPGLSSAALALHACGLALASAACLFLAEQAALQLR